MIHHHIKPRDYYGVSHNETSVLICLGSGLEYVRLPLTEEEATHLAQLLMEHVDKLKTGVWP